MNFTALGSNNQQEEEDPERQRLQISGALGPLYSEQVDPPAKVRLIYLGNRGFPYNFLFLIKVQQLL